MSTYHLAIDLGATSGRSIIATFDGDKIDMEELTRFRNPMLPIADHLFWNLPGLFDAILIALREVKKRGIELSSIGIDTWGCDVAYFNADGTIAGLPYCYRDPHTDEAPDKFFKRMSASELYGRTGIQFMNFNTVFQLDVIRPKADRILFIPDALAYMLTGNAVCEYTVASTSQMLNPVTGDLDEDILSTLGLQRCMFGKMVKPGTVIGRLTRQIQEATGLGEVPVIAVAGHDTASAVIGVPAETTDYAYLSCGTWSLLGIETPAPIITDAARSYNFTNEGGIDGTTRFLKNICGLWLFEQARKEFKNVPDDIAALAALCRESDCPSVIDPDDPSFAHPDSMTRAIADYCGRTGQPIPETPADYIRVIYRSLARKYGIVLGWLGELSPVKIKQLNVIGGGSKNSHLMQMTADELGIPVIAGPAESTALGNALVQLRGCGQAATLAEMRAIALRSVETKTYLPNQKQS